MKTSEMTIGSVVYAQNCGPVVVLGFADVASPSHRSRYRDTKTKRVMGAKIRVSAETSDVDYDGYYIRPQDVLRDFAPDCMTAVAKIVADRATSKASKDQETADLADRKARMAAVLTKMAELGIKQDDYRVDTYAREIKIPLADIEALLAKVA